MTSNKWVTFVHENVSYMVNICNSGDDLLKCILTNMKTAWMENLRADQLHQRFKVRPQQLFNRSTQLPYSLIIRSKNYSFTFDLLRTTLKLTCHLRLRTSQFCAYRLKYGSSYQFGPTSSNTHCIILIGNIFSFPFSCRGRIRTVNVIGNMIEKQ